MKKLLIFLLVTGAVLSTKAQQKVVIAADEINARSFLGVPLFDTLSAPRKIGELRTRVQDNATYRWNGSITGKRWDKLQVNGDSTAAGSLISLTGKAVDLGGRANKNATLSLANAFSILVDSAFTYNVQSAGGALRWSFDFPSGEIRTMAASGSVFERVRGDGVLISTPFSNVAIGPDSVSITGVKLFGVNTADSFYIRGIGTSSDTTTYKPFGIASNGRIKRMTSWFDSGPGGGSGRTDSLIGTSNRTTITGTNINPIIDISASYIGQSSITTLGTITAGIWNGTTIGVTVGGTGLSSYTAGDILTASSSTVLAKISDVGTGNALISGGIGTIPSWGKIGLTTHVTGVLGEGNGGTNQSTYTQGDLLYASASNTLSKLAKSATATRYLANTGASNAPQWDQINLSNGVTNTLPIGSGGSGQTGANAALNAFLPSQAGNAGKILVSDGTNTSWQVNAGGTTDSTIIIRPLFITPGTGGHNDTLRIKTDTAIYDANKLQDRNLASTAPTNGQAIVWSASNNDWEPGTVSGGGSLADPGNNGILVRTALNTTINRTLTTADATHISISNADGTAGNPTFDVGSNVVLLPTAQVLTGKKTFNSSATAAAGTGYGTVVTNTLTAAANNDVTAAIYINGSFTNGAFTGVTNYQLLANGDIGALHLISTGSSNGVYVTDRSNGRLGEFHRDLDTFYLGGQNSGSTFVYPIKISNNAPTGSLLLTSAGHINFGIAPATGGSSDSVLVFDHTTHDARMVAQSSVSGSGIALDAIQVYSSGSTVTVSNGNNVLFVDPASTQAALTITLPSTPHNSNLIYIHFGGTLTSGAVITSLSIAGTPIQAVTPTTASAGEVITYRWRSSTSKWYRIN